MPRGRVESIKLNKTKSSLNLILGGSYLKIVSSLWLSIFTLLGPGLPQRPSGCLKSKSCIKQKWQGPNYRGCPCNENCQNFLILFTSSCQPHHPDLFSLAVVQKSKLCSQRFSKLFPKRYETTPCPKPLRGDRLFRKANFRGLGLTSGSKSPAQKLLARS